MAVRLVLLDVNETLSDMAPVWRAVEEVGGSFGLGRAWFASVLRDGFALAVGGTSAPFADIARDLLAAMLPRDGLDRPRDEAVAHVMETIKDLAPHRDVAPGVRALAGSGRTLATLSNGSAGIAEDLLAGAGLRELVAHVLSADDAGVWKPARAAYAHALDVCGVEADEAVLVAVHPWDVDGASRAGLRTAWLNRDGGSWPSHFRPPDHEVAELADLAGQLA